jgi:hypothetical protein
MFNTEAWQRALAGAGQEVFDEIAIPHPNGRDIVTRIGLRLSLRFTDGNQLDKRLAAIAALRLYYSRFGANLTHYQANESTRVVRLTEFPSLDEEVRNLHEKTHFGVQFSGYAKGEDTRNATLFCVSVVCRWDPGENSTFEANLPVSMAVRDSYDRMVDFVRQTCDILSPIHGTFGIGLIFDHPDSQKYLAQSYFLLKKFPGLDYEDPSIFNAQVFRAKVGPQRWHLIRTVNWLTILGDSIVAKLGGPGAISSTSGPDCPVHRYKGGLIIQAGPQPELGSSENGVCLKLIVKSPG